MRPWQLLLVMITLVVPLMPAAEEVSQEVSREVSQEFHKKAHLVVPTGAQFSDVDIQVDDTSRYRPSATPRDTAGKYSPPDFSGFSNTSDKKAAFYDYLLPMIHHVNLEIVVERQMLLLMSAELSKGGHLTTEHVQELDRVERRYGVLNDHFNLSARINDLLERVDVVPASLVVAQAAKESGWGTSRFAVQGNNFFGIWCFHEGCGIKPRQRDLGLNHEVATFDTVEQGVRHYVRTINTHVAYGDLRELRARARERQQLPEGEQLANGLVHYSQRGEAYVKEIQFIIRHNQLQRFSRIYSV